MWPAKMAGEGSNLHGACAAMCDVMRELGVAVDGGKDSLTMVAKVTGEDGAQWVKSVPSLVVSCYAPCPDITRVVTPDLKRKNSSLVWVPFQREIPVLGEFALIE